MPSIFDKVRLRPAQLRTVADRRLGDAEALRKTGRNERANGAMYLGGFVLECLLKALLLERYPWLGRRPPRPGDKVEQRLWSLCYRMHDLDEIVHHLPELTDRLRAWEQRGSARAMLAVRKICGQWTIFARYSPRSGTIKEADGFLADIMELRRWLRQDPRRPSSTRS